VNDIITTDLVGTTCVLTKTNTEALHITGLLLKNGIQAKLIQTNDGFNLFNLLEVRHFLSLLNETEDVFVINDEVWENAKRELRNRFRLSTNLDIFVNLIRDFESTNTKKKYKSDLEVFIRESRLEDFFNEDGETIFVSTIHKAKGKEFDNVFLMLENFNTATNEARRLLYVAMTRAKRNLTVHLNAGHFDGFSAENLERMEDGEVYLPPNGIAIHPGYRDVWLDYFINKQQLIAQLSSGDTLILNGDECLNSGGQSVLKFSRPFIAQIEDMKRKNYELRSARVNFIVYWLKEGAAQEIRIILPELFFERKNSE
jgi:ATP-dependent DNA helicase RecQ